MSETQLYYADLHIHSKYSRATSRQLTPRHLAAWGWVKGIDLLATGDFTHPAWLALLQEQLEEDGRGLLRLKEPTRLEQELPWLETPVPKAPRFMLGTEISSIYKRGGVVRKVHNLVYLPNFDAVRRFNERLDQVGNLEADGRPILGLDSEHLLEMVLETDPLGFVIPAHIWTPWFSLFGSKSGFNALEECFGSLSQHIFAAETGLSSDPAMNWHWSALDHLTLVSNSDAHSGANLAREATLFSGAMDFATIREGLRDRSTGTFQGTLEFFPEEGKYHHDGHRKCGLSWDPRQTEDHGGICPVCGRPVTVGVLNRILELADRKEPLRPPDHPDFVSLVPLPELLSELLSVGPKSKTVQRRYCRLLAQFGPELTILRHTPVEELRQHWSLLGKAVGRMRSGRVQRQPGFDGQYGVIRVFSDRERREWRHGPSLVLPTDLDHPSCTTQTAPGGTGAGREEGDVEKHPTPNPEQEAAVQAGPEPVLVQAGPGTGKTRTLLARVRRLLEQGTPAKEILLLTFTRATAEELRNRLQLETSAAVEIQAGTLHSLAYAHFVQHHGRDPVLLSEEDARSLFVKAVAADRHECQQMWTRCQLARESGILSRVPAPGEAEYQEAKARRGVVDFTDLLQKWLQGLTNGARPEWTQILIDEIQDLTGLQLNLVQALCPPQGHGFFGIGDPDQSIYGFRGAVSTTAEWLSRTWPELTPLSLQRNYRAAAPLVQAAGTVFPERPPLRPQLSVQGQIVVCETPSAWREASWIATQVRTLIGATAHSQADSGDTGETSPGDIAVLVRTRALLRPLAEKMDQAGVPCSVPEEEPFWRDSRVQDLLETVRAAFDRAVTPPWDCPEAVLGQGPAGMAAYWAQSGPVDPLFWQSRAFQQLQQAFADQGDWEALLTWLARQDTLDTVRHRVEKVRLMTLHASKGLEFTAVFLPALEEGLLPYGAGDFGSNEENTALTADRLAEEKRLFYVGLTRAKRYLYLSHSQERRLYGQTLAGRPSRFLQSLPPSLVQTKTVVARTKQRSTQLTLM